MTDLVEVLSAAMPTYDRTLFVAESSIMFHGKSLSGWIDELNFVSPDEGISVDNLEVLNSDFIRQNEVVMNSLSCARAAFDLSKVSFTLPSNAFKDSERITRQENGSRMPSLDILDVMAKNHCSDQYTSFKISEIFLEFWKTMYDKLKLIDNRLTGLNILRNVESRYAFKS